MSKEREAEEQRRGKEHVEGQGEQRYRMDEESKLRDSREGKARERH